MPGKKIYPWIAFSLGDLSRLLHGPKILQINNSTWKAYVFVASGSFGNGAWISASIDR